MSRTSRSPAGDAAKVAGPTFAEWRAEHEARRQAELDAMSPAERAHDEARRAEREAKRVETNAKAAQVRAATKAHAELMARVKTHRKRLIKFLAMLGSDSEAERMMAAKMAEQTRKLIGLEWDELIRKGTV